MAKSKQCNNCKHVERTHYKKTKDSQLPDTLVGQCKVPFCKCIGFEAQPTGEK